MERWTLDTGDGHEKRAAHSLTVLLEVHKGGILRFRVMCKSTTNRRKTNWKKCERCPCICNFLIALLYKLATPPSREIKDKAHVVRKGLKFNA